MECEWWVSYLDGNEILYKVLYFYYGDFCGFGGVDFFVFDFEFFCDSVYNSVWVFCLDYFVDFELVLKFYCFV